jgi:hypothetical protein
MNKIRLALLAAIAGAGIAASAHAGTDLVKNGSFEDTNNSGHQYFQGDVADWSGGANLTFLDTPGSATTDYLEVYPGFPATSPDGGNFVEADGDPSYSDAFSQTITGLYAGKTYTVSFYQAAGQQDGFPGPTTERWQVSLGSETDLSSKYSLPQGGIGPWEKQYLTFTATASSEVLTFLAVGTPGGAPPISFLDGVSLSAPEPGSWALMIVGVGAVGGILRRRRQMGAVQSA